MGFWGNAWAVGWNKFCKFLIKLLTNMKKYDKLVVDSEKGR